MWFTSYHHLIENDSCKRYVLIFRFTHQDLNRSLKLLRDLALYNFSLPHWIIQNNSKWRQPIETVNNFTPDEDTRKWLTVKSVKTHQVLFVTVGNTATHVTQLSVCARWYHSHHMRKFSGVTGRKNLYFLWLFSAGFIRSTAIINQINTNLLSGTSICCNMRVLSDMVQAVDHRLHLNKSKPFTSFPRKSTEVHSANEPQIVNSSFNNPLYSG
jgi:hypothetical protein